LEIERWFKLIIKPRQQLRRGSPALGLLSRLVDVVRQMDFNRTSIVADYLNFPRGIDAGAYSGSDKDDAEGALLHHARELACAPADGKRSLLVIPFQRNGRVCTLFVIVAVALVFVER